MDVKLDTKNRVLRINFYDKVYNLLVHTMTLIVIIWLLGKPIGYKVL